MTHKFKPGDKVRIRHSHTVSEVLTTAVSKLWFVDGGEGHPDNYELAEPSVTHRELREVLEELKQRDSANTSWSAALEAYFFQLTGEQP